VRKLLKKIIRLNLDDLLLYICVEAGVFLLMEIIIGCVMYFVRPGDSMGVACVLLPIIAGFLALIAGISHVGVTFDQALRFGQTRLRATLLTLGLAAFEAAFALALAALLTAVERFACPHLWAALSGADNWVLGRSGVIQAAAPPPGWEGAEVPVGRFFENMAGERVPLPENTLLISIFTLDWYWWLLIFAIALAGGIVIGALIQRFGSKGGWIIWGICMAPCILGQLLPWKTYEITNWLWPLLAVLFVLSFLWSLWSMLHAVVRT